ncbi:MAG: SUMF1/EgtB/PvdO family nonheme iron enzyme [Caldilineaceae bacterium]|nr:SUMF1/EgtB/PvdO family nonheme iron enzyme [Caldilineaceae bacterium]
MVAQQVIHTIPERLTAAIQNRDLPCRQRLDAGLLLADLHILPPDVDDFVPIAARAELGYDFRMGKYPITNSQYRRFFDDGGYAEDRSWWTEEAVKDIESWEKDWRKGPRLWGDPRFDRDTQPVVGVSWCEAVAYCEWLTDKLRAEGKISRDEIVRLPTEKEWQWVAAGAEGRTYAWGPEFTLWRVNSKESSLDQPTPSTCIHRARRLTRRCGTLWQCVGVDK